MPTYTYRREDGSTFEVEQRITEDPLKTCPTTGQPVKRIITAGAGLVFKGSGFYLTDYSRGSAPASTESGGPDSGSPNGDSSGDAGSKADGSTEKKKQTTAESSTDSSKGAESKKGKSSKSGSSTD